MLGNFVNNDNDNNNNKDDNNNTDDNDSNDIDSDNDNNYNNKYNNNNNNNNYNNSNFSRCRLPLAWMFKATLFQNKRAEFFSSIFTVILLSTMWHILHWTS